MSLSVGIQSRLRSEKQGSWIWSVLALLTPLLLWFGLPRSPLHGETVVPLWGLLFVALVPLLVLALRGSRRQVLGFGGVAIMLHHLVLLYWVTIALDQFGHLGAVVATLALILLAAYVSLYSVAFLLIARWFSARLPVFVLLWLLPALWVAMDWLRGVLFSGFPWMDLGYGIYLVQPVVQLASLFGHHGLTYLVVFSNVLLALLLVLLLYPESFRRRNSYGARSQSGRFWRRSFPLLLAAVLLAGLSFGYSQTRLAQLARQSETGEKAVVGVVQGNIDQSLKWSVSMQRSTVATYLMGTAELSQGTRPELIVWPETALPFYPTASPYIVNVRDAAVEENVSLLVGAPWFEHVGSTVGSGEEATRRNAPQIELYNSALLIAGGSGDLAGRYSKHHLVPFGEYVPLKKYLFFLGPVVETIGDFKAGSIERPLTTGSLRCGVLICFESVFPELARRWVDLSMAEPTKGNERKSGANLLVNLTNDAWYGKSSAPWQSLAMTALRAVETGRSLVRAANTGISAFIGPDGRIAKASGLFEPWVAKNEVLLSDERTLFVRFGSLFAPYCLMISGFFLLYGLLARKRNDG